jgi:hypothetical protein
VDFLTVALVKPSADNASPLALQPCVGIAGYVPSPAVVSHRRQHVLYRDLPALVPSNATNASSDPALVEVARGMRAMVAETATIGQMPGKWPGSPGPQEIAWVTPSLIAC